MPPPTTYYQTDSVAAQPFLSAVLTPDGFLRKDIDLLQLLDSSVRPTQYAVAKTVFTLEVLQNGELHKHAADEETKKLGAALKALGEKLTGPITAADLSTVRRYSRLVTRERHRALSLKTKIGHETRRT